MGPMKAKGNLSAPRIQAMGPLNVVGNLEIHESLSVMGPLKVGGNLYTKEGALSKINGPASILGEVQGGEIKINGPLKAKNIDVFSLRLNGTARVEHNILATDKISFGVGYRTEIDVGGIIQAPLVEFRYQKANELMNKLRDIFFKRLSDTGVFIDDLRIRTKILRLYKVEVMGDIQAEEIQHLEYINE